MSDVPTYSFSEFLTLLLASLTMASDESVGPVVYLREDPQTLHNVFFKLRQDFSKQFPPLQDLHFITAGSFPYSPDLTEALDNLQLSGVLSRLNPSYDKFSPKSFKDSPTWLKASRGRVTRNDPRLEKALGRIIQSLKDDLVAA